MQDNAKRPQATVEMVGAEYLPITSTVDGVHFSFGDGDYWAPRKLVKFVDSVMYVPQWIASANKYKWHGEFIAGSKHTRMQAVDDELTTTLEQAIDTIETQLGRLQRALKKRREAQQTPDKTIDEGTAKIMRAINKTN